MGRYEARLADRIVREQCSQEYTKLAKACMQRIIEQVAKVPRFIIDQVMCNISSENEITGSYEIKACDLPQPPYDSCFFEGWWPAPWGAFGYYIEPVRKADCRRYAMRYGVQHPTKAYYAHCVRWKGKNTLHYVGSKVYIVDEGPYISCCVLIPPKTPTTKTDLELLDQCFDPLRIALTLLACKGVVVANVTNPGGVRPVGRMKKEELTYKTLLIGGRKTHSERVSLSEITGVIRAHMRRGNIATYTQDKPHVSGHVGPMWRTACVVGDANNGKVVKDYAIKT